MADYQTAYQALGTHDEEEDADDNDIPVSEEYMIQVCPESSKSRWNHIEDLDDFFTRVYHYHQRSGFTCMAVEDLLQLVQFVFVALFSAFLASCVSYDVLFANVHYNTSHKVTISEAVIPLDQCVARLSPVTVICLLLACVTWLIRVIKVVYNIFKYFEIRSFYVQALKINAGDLPNMTWHEVQARLIEAQKEQQMCIHRKELTQLDIYHRILRFKNYIVAMANISLLPLKYNIPFLGEYAFLSTGLKYNLEFILFWGPWAPFENSWHLRNEYKSPRNRERLAQSLSTKILWLGILNLIFCPVVFVWQIIYSFFRYAELIKRQPSILGSRKWSNYARLTVRHFNELDHEFSARLNKGYQPMTDYLNIFTTPLVVIIAKNMVFFAGAIMAILLGLTVVDEDVLNVEHVLTIITLSGVCVTVCRSLIPPEHIIFSPELLLRNVAMAIHYMPDNWSGQAHTARVRDACTLLFQFKIVYILEELLSPLLTPLILIFCIRPHSAAIVDFFRRFTVEVVGVGDVCSFAQMDVKKHGNKEWQPSSQASPPKSQQANGGKTEMSLMHFHHTNPEWKPSEDCSEFINTFKGQAVLCGLSAKIPVCSGYQHSTSPSNLPVLEKPHSVCCHHHDSLLVNESSPSLQPVDASHAVMAGDMATMDNDTFQHFLPHDVPHSDLPFGPPLPPDPSVQQLDADSSDSYDQCLSESPGDSDSDFVAPSSVTANAKLAAGWTLIRSLFDSVVTTSEHCSHETGAEEYPHSSHPVPGLAADLQRQFSDALRRGELSDNSFFPLSSLAASFHTYMPDVWLWPQMVQSYSITPFKVPSFRVEVSAASWRLMERSASVSFQVVCYIFQLAEVLSKISCLTPSESQHADLQTGVMALSTAARDLLALASLQMTNMTLVSRDAVLKAAQLAATTSVFKDARSSLLTGSSLFGPETKSALEVHHRNPLQSLSGLLQNHPVDRGRHTFRTFSRQSAHPSQFQQCCRHRRVYSRRGGPSCCQPIAVFTSSSFTQPRP